MSQIDLALLNDFAWKVVDDYQKLKIFNNEVSCPYYMNYVQGFFVNLMQGSSVSESKIAGVTTDYHKRQIPYGWYRGKGTPEQIGTAVETISKKVNMDIRDSSPSVILEFMKLFGLGVDCSGFFYNILWLSLAKRNEQKLLTDCLDWKGSKYKSVFQAGTSVFSGKASELIKFSEIKPLDFVLIKNPRGQNKHIALFLIKQDKMYTVHSTIAKSPSGIWVDEVNVKNGNVLFSFKPEMGNPWEKLVTDNRLEFRRLKIFN